MNWYLDVFADDVNDTNSSALASIQRCLEQDRSGPCEDDCEVTAPFVGLLPEETDHEEMSPLDFGGARRFGERPATSLASNIFQPKR
jgi:hypothetical protein